MSIEYKYIFRTIEYSAFVLYSLTLIFLIKNYRKEKIFIPFLLYILACYVVFNFRNPSPDTIQKIGSRNLKIMYEFINSFYTITEFFAFYLFLIIINKNDKLTKFIKPIVIIFAILTFSYFSLLTSNTFKISEISPPSIALNIIEYSILLFLCLYSYYALAQKPINTKPINIYNLWTLNSLFFYISISLPIIIIANKINPTSQLYTIMFMVHYTTIIILLATLFFSVKNKSF